MVISFLPAASSLNVILDSPSEVNLNKEFTVGISADSEEIHDVKIFVHTSRDDKIDREEYISEIYNAGWKNPYYYIKGVFPEKTVYQIKVIESPGKMEICGRLREPETKDFHTECNRITVTLAEEIKEEEDEIEEEDEEPEEIEFEPLSATQEIEPIPEPTQLAQEEKIILNSPQQEPTQLNKETFITKSEKKRLWLIYAFTFFCIIIIVLLALRKL